MFCSDECEMLRLTNRSNFSFGLRPTFGVRSKTGLKQQGKIGRFIGGGSTVTLFAWPERRNYLVFTKMPPKKVAAAKEKKAVVVEESDDGGAADDDDYETVPEGSDAEADDEGSDNESAVEEETPKKGKKVVKEKAKPAAKGKKAKKAASSGGGSDDDGSDADAEGGEKKRRTVKFDYNITMKFVGDLLEAVEADIATRSKKTEPCPRILTRVAKDLTRLAAKLPGVLKKNRPPRVWSAAIISDELRAFLQLKPDEEVSREEVIQGVWAYFSPPRKPEAKKRWGKLNLDKNGKPRKLMENKVLTPDKALIKLFKYDEYKAAVAAGKITCKRKDENNKHVTVTITDPAITMGTIQALLSFAGHIKPKPKEAPAPLKSKKAAKVKK